MSNLRFKTVAASIGLAALGYSANAQATVLLDANLGAPGVYYGSGNPNGHFTVTTESAGTGTVEVGQRAIERYVGTITPQSGTNIYNVSTGPTTEPGKTGSDWGFVFSVNLDSSGLVLNHIVPRLTLVDVGTGSVGSLDLLLIPDNGHILGGGGTQNDCSLAAVCNNALDTGFQNSEALQFSAPADFASLLGDAAYNINANDTYYFRLDLLGSGSCPLEGCAGALLATNTIVVVAGDGAVPEPATLALFGAGLMGLGAIRRRKQKSA